MGPSGGSLTARLGVCPEEASGAHSTSGGLFQHELEGTGGENPHTQQGVHSQGQAPRGGVTHGHSG